MWNQNCSISSFLSLSFSNVSNVLIAEWTPSIFIAFAHPIICFRMLIEYDFENVLRIIEAQSKGKVKNTEPRTEIPRFL